MKSLHRTLFVFAAIALLAVTLSGCSRQARLVRHLAQADKYLAAHQYDLAEIEYKNALQLQPLNPHAIGQLGIMYHDQGRLGRAFPYLVKGRELDPENLPLRLKLGQTYLATGNLPEARDDADFILTRQPQNEEAPLLLAETAVKPREIDETRQRLLSLPSPAPASAPVLVALGTLDFRQHLVKEAEAKFVRALALAPESVTTNSALGVFYWTQNDLVRAEKALAEAARLAPARSFKRLQYAHFKIQHGEPEAGRNLLREMTRETPDFLPAWIWLAEISASEKKFGEGAALLAKALARDPLLPDALLLSARMELLQGETDKAVAALERMRTLYPKSPQVRYQLGLAYLGRGDIDQAVASLNEAITMDPSLADAIALLASINIRKGDLNTAIVSLKQLVQQHPDLPQARLLLADAYRGQNNLDDALATYRQLEASFPRNPQTSLLIGLVLAQQNKTDEARQAFSKALELAPDYAPALEQLVNLDLVEKQYTTARQRVDGQIARTPTLAGPYLLLAKIFFSQQDTKQAEGALKKAIELQPDSRTAYFLLARLYVDSGQQDKALANLQELIAKNPKDVAALMLIALIHDQQRDYPSARDFYEKLLAINPRFSPALNNLAYLYSEHLNDLEKAHKMAQRARELFPHEPHNADTLGWILYKEHRYPWALTLLQESAEKLPGEAEVQFHLGMTHYMMGEEGPARSALQRALQLGKDFPGVAEANQCLSLLAIDPKAASGADSAALNRALANRADDPIALSRLAAIYEADGDLNRAVSACEAVLKTNPKNISAIMTLVRLHSERQEPAQAFALAKEARDLAHEDPAVIHTLGRLAFQTADFQWAFSLLQEAARRQPDDPETLYDLAEAAYGVGRIPDAVTAMRSALRLTRPFSRADKARLFLEMAELSADPPQAVKAAARIDQILGSDPRYAPALQVQAVIAETKSDLPAARQVYAKLLDVYPDFAPAKRSLAILDAEKPGDDPKTYALAVSARKAFPDDPDLARALGIIVYRQGIFPRAEELLQEGAQRRPDDPVLFYYLGMSQYQLKHDAAGRGSLERALDLHLRPDLAAEARRMLAGSK